MWVYICQTDGTFTVGYWFNHWYQGEQKLLPKWHAVDDFNTEVEARALVHYLNGGE